LKENKYFYALHLSNLIEKMFLSNNYDGLSSYYVTSERK